MAKKRNRITAAMSKTIADSSPLIKKSKLQDLSIESSENNIITVSLEKLQTNPYQPRIDINLQSLNELISSIEQNGLLQPIVVTKPQNDGNRTIIAGHRRFEAYKIMGKTEIQAIVIDDINDKDLAILSLTENLVRENLHPIENAIAMKNILTNNIVESQNKLAEYLGLSKGYVSKLMNILKLPTSIVKKIKDENYKDINVLVLLNKLSSETDMLSVYENIKNLPRIEAEKYIKNKLLVKKPQKTSPIDIKATAIKTIITVNTKKLTENQKELLKQKVDELHRFVEQWN